MREGRTMRTNAMVIPVLAFLFALTAGSVPFSWLIGRYRYGVDLRATGDGNVGAGNLLGCAGMAPALAAIVLDLLKGGAAVAFAIAIAGDEWVVLTAGVMAIVGHIFPPWLGFDGGRGAAPAIGVGWALFPFAGVAMLALGLVALTLTRSTTIAIAIAVVGLVVIVFATDGDLGRLLFVALLFIAVGLKDTWDRVRALRHPRGVA